MNATERLQARYEAALMPNYGVPPLALARGEGCRVWDADGREYTDMFAGIAVSSLGHAHPAIIEAVSRQVRDLAHTSNLFVHEGEVALAERLLSLLGASPLAARAAARAAAGCSSPTRAPRPTRPPSSWSAGTRAQDRPVFVAAEDGFHGRTMGALALTGKSSIREPFGPFGLTVRFVPYGDVAALQAATRDDTAAVFLEPALGEGGVVPPPPGYLQAARDVCDVAGALLVADEIQSGIGRTGAWFACQADGFTPDVLTLAKGLGGGLRSAPASGWVMRAPRCARATTAAHSAATRWRAPRPSPCWTRSRPTACWSTRRRWAASSRTAWPSIRHPLLRGVRGRGLWLAAVLYRAPRGPGGGGRQGRRFPGERRPAGRDPARAPADPQPGPGLACSSPPGPASSMRSAFQAGQSRPAGGLTCPGTSGARRRQCCPGCRSGPDGAREPAHQDRAAGPDRRHPEPGRGPVPGRAVAAAHRARRAGHPGHPVPRPG